MLIAELFDCVKFLNGVNIGSKNLNSCDKNKISTTFKFMLFDILGFNKENEKVETLSFSLLKSEMDFSKDLVVAIDFLIFKESKSKFDIPLSLIHI